MYTDMCITPSDTCRQQYVIEAETATSELQVGLSGLIPRPHLKVMGYTHSQTTSQGHGIHSWSTGC